MNKRTALTLEEAVEICREALRGLMEAERALGWALAREKLEGMAFLLDDIDAGELETRLSLAQGHGLTFPDAKSAIKWLQAADGTMLSLAKEQRLKRVSKGWR